VGAGLLPTIETAIASEERQSQVPLYDEGAMVRVPVNAFGRTLYFVVDTGFTISAIDLKYRQFLGREVNECAGKTPLGNDQAITAFQCPFMSLAGKPLNLEKLLCLDLQMAALISGKPCDGVLGMDYFMKNVVSLNFDEHIFAIADAVPEDIKETFLAVRIKQREIFCLMEARINQGRQVDLMIDTGDTGSLSLNQEEWRHAFAGDLGDLISTTVADTANQVAQSKIGVVRKLEVGNFDYNHLHATLIRNPGSPSHVGLGFFRRHNVTFDFARCRLYLQPGGQFSTPDREDMSGLHLLRRGQTTFVYSVDEDSPAFDCGMRRNDIIELLNGRNTVSMTMKNVRNSFQSHDGDSITLKVRRGGKVCEFEFALKQTI
jgi:predicted aspartyl protease